jgi:hypothetical protein
MENECIGQLAQYLLYVWLDHRSLPLDLMSHAYLRYAEARITCIAISNHVSSSSCMSRSTLTRGFCRSSALHSPHIALYPPITPIPLKSFKP